MVYIVRRPYNWSIDPKILKCRNRFLEKSFITDDLDEVYNDLIRSIESTMKKIRDPQIYQDLEDIAKSIRLKF